MADPRTPGPSTPDPSTPRSRERLSVVAVAGGRGTRLGGVELGDKARRPLDGAPMLATTVGRIASAVRAQADKRDVGEFIVVGPRIELDAQVGSMVDSWVVEDPPGSGPCAAVVAGANALRPKIGDSADLVLVAAGDAPRLGDAIAALAGVLDANHSADVAVLSHGGHIDHLAALWRSPALSSAVSLVPDRGVDHPVRALYRHATSVVVDDVAGWSVDIDTPDDLDAWRNPGSAAS